MSIGHTRQRHFLEKSLLDVHTTRPDHDRPPVDTLHRRHLFSVEWHDHEGVEMCMRRRALRKRDIIELFLHETGVYIKFDMSPLSQIFQQMQILLLNFKIIQPPINLITGSGLLLGIFMTAGFCLYGQILCSSRCKGFASCWCGCFVVVYNFFIASLLV